MSDAQQHLNEAYRLLAAGEDQLEHAFEQIEACLRIEPDNVEALVFRGRMLDHVEHYVDAFLSYARALELEPENMDALLHTSTNACSRERYEDAWEALGKVGDLLKDMESNGIDMEEEWVDWVQRRVTCLLDWAGADETAPVMAKDLREAAITAITGMRQRFPDNTDLAALHGEVLDHLAGAASAPAAMPKAAPAPSPPATPPGDVDRRLRAIAAARCEDREPAHDWQHVLRVTENARRLAEAEGADLRIVVPAALLHELVNYPKHHPEAHLSGEACAKEAASVLSAEGYPAALIGPISEAIRCHGFSRGLIPETLEGKILQDADRLDAIGAIGVARVFATCADMKRPFYNAEDPFCEGREPDDKAWGLDHFYRKLLRIPGTLHTATAKAMARERVVFLEAYLAQLRRELPALTP